MAEKKLSKKNVTQIFSENAKEEATRVCGLGQCYSCYDCGHTNKVARPFDKYGTGETCPLEKYLIEPDTRTFKERLEAGEWLSPEKELEYLFALCACCEHADVIEKDGYYELSRADETYDNYCIDCPTNQAREGIEECMAEAAMS